LYQQLNAAMGKTVTVDGTLIPRVAATRGDILTFDSIVLLPGAYYHGRF